MPLLVGYGYDIHRLEAGRPMRIGGVDIPEATSGPVAHSDGDVLVHALCDALLGAAALGDIGVHFPDTDPKWRGAHSITLLAAVVELLKSHALAPRNVDCMVILEAPRIARYRQPMRECLSDALGLPVGRVSVKATTAEGIGEIGRGEAVAAHAVATIDSAFG